MFTNLYRYVTGGTVPLDSYDLPSSNVDNNRTNR